LRQILIVLQLNLAFQQRFFYMLGSMISSCQQFITLIQVAGALLDAVFQRAVKRLQVSGLCD